MADYRAISTGVASDLARWQVWDGSAWVAATVLPTLGDDVYANGFTVTLDTDFSCSLISTQSPPNGGSAGGGFTFGAGDILTGDVRAGSTVCLTNATAQRKFVIGDVYGGSGNNAFGFLSSGTGGSELIGTGYGGSGASAQGFRNTAGLSNVYGNGIGGVGNFASGVHGQGGDLTVHGEAVAGVQAGVSVNTTIIHLFRAVRRSGDGLTAMTTLGASARIYVKELINEVDNSLLASGWGTNIFLDETGPVKVELTFPRLNSPAETTVLLSETDQAAPADVRLGTTYANGALTGTLPPATTLDTVLAAIAAIKVVP